MSFQVRITTGAPSAIYRQIADQIRHAIATRTLAEGDPLPSVRNLAEQLLLNPNTVARAYSDLVRDGVLESLPGKGLIVAPRRQVFTKAERLRRIDPALTTLLHEAIALGFSAGEIQTLLAQKIDAMDLHPK
jgi:GntR family transcriptional regulator